CLLGGPDVIEGAGAKCAGRLGQMSDLGGSEMVACEEQRIDRRVDRLDVHANAAGAREHRDHERSSSMSNAEVEGNCGVDARAAMHVFVKAQVFGFGIQMSCKGA